MFNHMLKKEATKIRENSIARYDVSYRAMEENCIDLYEIRKMAVSVIADVTRLINTISHKPQSFDSDFGEVGKEVDAFTSLEVYAKQEFEAAVKAGVGAATCSAAGASIASLGPNTLMGIATVFGKATTGRAVSTLSGQAAKRAAIGWIGRTFGGIAVKQGSGYVVGKTILALCGPIGWGITATSAGSAIVSLTLKNRKISDTMIEEAKTIERAREAVDECSVSIQYLGQRTQSALDELHNDVKRLYEYEGANYSELGDEEKYYLGSIVNKTRTLSKLLNETIT